MASNRHHIIPRSRQGNRRGNIVVLPTRFHEALHMVFGNLCPDEYAEFLELLLVPGRTWTGRELEELRELCKR